MTHTKPTTNTTIAHSPLLEERLWQLHRELRSHALRLTRSPHEADDLVQDTMERALRFSSQFTPGTNLRGWVHRILQNQFISDQRKLTRERRWLLSAREDPTWARGARLDPSSMMGLTSNTQRAIGALPTHYRKTLRLVDLEGHSYQEAAERLGVPVGTVMSRLHRARKLLAIELEQPGSSQESLAA